MLPRLRASTRLAHSLYTPLSARPATLHTSRATMSSSTNQPQPTPSGGSSSKDDLQQQQQQQQSPAPPAPAAGSKPIEALPAPGEGTSSSHPVLDVSSGGGTISLDAMGPIVVNRDGTIARVQNWSKMTEIEKQNTLRILGKRNQQRLASLREAEKAQGGGEGSEAKGSE